MTEDRNRLRATFDGAALLYDQVRPGYPEGLFEDIVSLSGISPGERILDENMAAVARRNLGAYPQTEVYTGAFEEWPLQRGAFDLAVSATAFHWLDPATAYPRVATALRDRASLALFWSEHVHTDVDSGFFQDVQNVYEREAPEIVGPEDYKGPPRPDQVPDRTPEIEDSGLFEGTTTRRYRWDETYDAAGYLRVLNTYSGHRNLQADTRDRLFSGITKLIDANYGGSIVKGYLTILYVAHKK